MGEGESRRYSAAGRGARSLIVWVPGGVGDCGGWAVVGFRGG